MMVGDFDGGALLARFREGPARLEQALAGLDDAALDAAPAAGGWSVREIVHHLADGDQIWTVGLKAALGGAGGEFSLEWYGALPQTRWAAAWSYPSRALDPSLAMFRAGREHVGQLLDHLPEAWDRTIGLRNPDGTVETITVREIVAMLAEHLDHHLRRIGELLGR